VTDEIERFIGSAIPACRFPERGTTWAGEILDMEVRQQRDLDGNPLTWDDGTPRMQLVVTLQTDARDPSIDDDDGRRRLFVQGGMRSALRDALRRAKVRKPEVGGHITVTYVDDEPPRRRGFSPAKRYRVEYRPPAGPSLAATDAALADVDDDEEPF
jgi:hypothetical protein